ncbi:hypothetical protein Tco_0541052 [Tanacetum coccineum]
MPYPRFTKIIINHFISQNKSISMRNRINLHTARDDSLLGTLKYVSKTEEHQVYGALIPKEMLNEDILNSTAYQTYYAYVNGAKEPKKARKFKKPASPKLKTVPVSPKEPNKKPAKGKKDVSQTRKPATKPKPTKKKASIKADRGKGLNVLSAVALSETAQLKEATKRSKKDVHISHASGSGDGTDFESGVPDEQQRKISGIDEGTGTKPGVPDVPKYDSKSEKESWGDSGEEDDDDEDDSEDESDDDNNDDDADNDDNDDNGDNDDNDDDKEKEECVDEFTDEEDNADNVKEETKEEIDDAEELYRDVNMNLRKEDVEMTDAHQGGADQHNVSQESGFNSSVSSNFTDKLLNFENAFPTGNEIASLMDTTVRHEEPSGHTSSHYIVPVTVITKITSAFTTTIPPPPPSFNPLLQQATPTPTPTASEVTTSFPALPDFSSLFRFNDRVTNLERDLSEMKQVDQHAQAISSIPAIVAQGANHTVDDSGVQQNQEFDMGNNDEQPDDEAASKVDWYKKLKQHSTSDPNWDKRQDVDFRPPQTWISNIARAKKPPTSFDEHMDTPIDFFAFVLNRLNITNLTQELLVRLAFNLLMRYFSFGGHLEELHVTWAHLEKKRTRLRTYTNISQDYVLSSWRRHHSFYMMASEITTQPII